MLPVLKGTQTSTLISVMGPGLSAPTAGTEKAAHLMGLKFFIVSCSKLFLDAASLVRPKFFAMGKTIRL